MAIEIQPLAQIAPERLQRLEAALELFYAHPPDSYYQIADANQRYEPGALPFHCHLQASIPAGSTVCEVGCGTAHFCPGVQARGAAYTGLDWSAALLEENRRRQPGADFLPASTAPEGRFDFVVSLYTLEHVPNPVAYLERLWSLCRPGGRVGVICPAFAQGDLLPPSLFYGLTPRRFSHKVKSGALLDALLHLWDLKVTAPRWQKRVQTLPAGQFWINLRPRILEMDAQEFDIDFDAVHFPRYEDLDGWFRQQGGVIEASSRTLQGIDPHILRFNQYFLVRKPGTTG